MDALGCGLVERGSGQRWASGFSSPLLGIDGANGCQAVESPWTTTLAAITSARSDPRSPWGGAIEPDERVAGRDGQVAHLRRRS
jgi:hypothetical protein